MPSDAPSHGPLEEQVLATRNYTTPLGVRVRVKVRVRAFTSLWDLSPGALLSPEASCREGVRT